MSTVTGEAPGAASLGAVQAQVEAAVAGLGSPQHQIRAQSDQFLKELRQSPHLLAVVQHILEHSTVPAAQFQAASALLDTIARLYHQLPTQHDKKSLCQYLFAFLLIHRGHTLANYVVQKLAQAAAVVFKLGFLVDSDDDRRRALHQILQLLTAEERHQRKIALQLVIAVLDEFSAKKATAVGVAWDFHRDCQHAFETTHLRSVFESVLGLVHVQIQEPALRAATSDDVTLVSLSLNVAERVLSWSPASNSSPAFESRRQNGVGDHPNVVGFVGGSGRGGGGGEGNRGDADDDGAAEMPNLPATWRDLMLSPALIGLFFDVSRLFMTDPTVCRKARRCLIQLAGLRGDVVRDAGNRKMYASLYLDHALQHLSLLQQTVETGSLADAEEHILDVAQIANQMLSNFKAMLLMGVAAFKPFLQQMGSLTTMCLRNMVDDLNDSWSAEASEELLAVWSSLVFELEFMSEEDQRALAADAGQANAAAVLEFLPDAALNIFEAYLEVRLRLARGAIEQEDDDEQDADAQFKDIELYSEELHYIGILARINSVKCTAVLGQMLMERRHALAQLYADPIAASQSAAGAILSEETHWLVLVAGHVLADAAEGEKPMIPRSLLQLSMHSPQNDPCVTLPTCVFNILDLVTVAPGTPQQDITSPLLVETLLWFVERWGSTYLFVDASEYTTMSPSILNAFGAAGGAPQALDFLLDKVQRNFATWHAETDIVRQIVSVLDGLATNRDSRSAFLASPKFNDVIQFFLSNLERLPASVHSDLIRTVVYIVTHASSVERESYFLSLGGAIDNMLVSVLHRPDFTRRYQNQDIQEHVINALEIYDGLVLAIDMTTSVVIFEMCANHFDSFVKLLDLYRNSPEIEFYILQFFRDLVKHVSYDDLAPVHHQALCTAIIDVLQTYARNEVGRKRDKGRGNDEEELNTDLSILLEILCGLVTSAYEGLVREDILERQRKDAIAASGGVAASNAANGGTHTSTVDIATVVFFGVNQLLPLITEDMLSFPKLCSNYIGLVSHLIEYFPSRLAGLSQDLLTSLVKSLVFGLNHPMSVLGASALYAIEALSLYVWSEQARPTTTTATSSHSSTLTGTPAVTALYHHIDVLMQHVLVCVLYKPFDSQLVPVAADTVFALALSRPDTYKTLIDRMITQQPHQYQSRLSHSFTQVTVSLFSHEAMLRHLFMTGVFVVGMNGGSIGSTGRLGSVRELNTYRNDFGVLWRDVRGLLVVV